MTASHPLFDTLRQLADLADLRGETDLAADYRSAVSAMEPRGPAEPARIWQLALSGRLDSEPSLSMASRLRLRDLAHVGVPGAVRAATARLPNLLRTLLQRSTITAAEGQLLAHRYGIVTFDDLAAAIGDGRLRQGPGAALEPRLRDTLPIVQLDVRPITLGRSLDLAGALVDRMAAIPSIADVTISGDTRRAEPLVAAIVLVARSSDPPGAIDAVCALGGIDDVRHRGPRRAIVAMQQTEIDVRIAAPDDYGTVLFMTTGPQPHVEAVHRRSGRHRLAGREEDVYTHAGLPYMPPEVRHGPHDVAVAAAGPLPPLVSLDDIRGDLHMHTDWSDGRDPLDEMLAACHALGYEYIAITDHSESAAASRTVSRDALARQADAIAARREQYPAMTILHGLEVEILPDGRLDFDDRVLARLDIVLASLHDAAGQDAATLTRRCIQAMRHPLVNVITHPANRLVGRFAGYDLDFEALYAAAHETGTALEIDGAPSHLDLDGERARAAVAAGATVTIDSDCHRAAALARQMRLGVATARRGWVAAAHVLNTRPLADVRQFVAAKRRANLS